MTEFKAFVKGHLRVWRNRATPTVQLLSLTQSLEPLFDRRQCDSHAAVAGLKDLAVQNGAGHGPRRSVSIVVECCLSL